MIQTTIEQTDPQGRAIAVPADVLAAIEPAQTYLLERLRAAEHLPVQIKWHRFENRGSDGWAVDLHTEYDGLGNDQRLNVALLREPRQMRERLLDVTWDFAGLLSNRLKSNLREIRESLAELAAESRGE